MPVIVILHDDLGELTARQSRRPRPVRKELSRRASIKDFLESLGIPHTEIFRLTINNREVDFSALVSADDRIEAFGPPIPLDLSAPTLLRPDPLTQIRFAADANVGRLAELLRLAGFDTFYRPELPDRELARVNRPDKTGCC